MDYELTEQGEADMKNLAKRLQTIFPSFVTLSKENFTVSIMRTIRYLRASEVNETIDYFWIANWIFFKISKLRNQIIYRK